MLVFVRVRFCHCWLVTDCIIEAAVNRTNEAHSIQRCGVCLATCSMSLFTLGVEQISLELDQC